MLKGRARWWLAIALVAMAVLALTIIVVPSKTMAGCGPGVLCLSRTNPTKVWLTLAAAVAALFAILGAWVAQRRSAGTSGPPIALDP
jgi:hypothetical protein